MLISRMAIVGGSLASACYVSQEFRAKIKRSFPPEKPSTHPPRNGYKIYGYMGCPKSKISAIQERARLLFFTKELETAQYYALDRTALIDRLLGKDEPVVLQIEILEEEKIENEELWHDPLLKQPTALPVPLFTSFHPAIPPDIQKRCGLTVRVHHIVSCKFKLQGGSLCRAINYYIDHFGGTKSG